MLLNYQEKQHLVHIMFVLPALAVIAVFMVYPVIMNIGYSFTNWNGISSDFSFVGWDNYRRVLASREFVGIITNTIFFAIIYLPVLNIMALLLACLIRACGKLSAFFKAIIYFPCLLAPAVVGYIWRLIYDVNNGLLNKILRSIGLEVAALNWLGQKNTVLPSIALTVIWACVGYYMILYYAGIMAVPLEQYESAKIDGASVIGRFFHITLPNIRSSIRMNLVFSTMGVITMFDIPYTMTGGGPGYNSMTLALQIYQYNFNLQPNLGVTMTVTLLLFTIAVVLTQNFLLGKED